MAADEDIVYDRSLLAEEHVIGPFPITREMILAFVASTGQTHPLCRDEAQAKTFEHGVFIAPPTFCNIFIERFWRPNIRLEFGEIELLASQVVENLAPIRSGDTLEAKTRLQEVYSKTGRSGTMVFVVWETRFTNQHGNTVEVVRHTFVQRNRPKR